MINLTLNINSNKTLIQSFYLYTYTYTHKSFVALSYLYLLFEDNERESVFLLFLRYLSVSRAFQRERESGVLDTLIYMRWVSVTSNHGWCEAVSAIECVRYLRDSVRTDTEQTACSIRSYILHTSTLAMLQHSTFQYSSISYSTL